MQIWFLASPTLQIARGTIHSIPIDTRFFARAGFPTPRRKNKFRSPSAEIKERFLFFQASHFPVKEVAIQIDRIDDGFRQTGIAKPNALHSIQLRDLPREEVLLALPTPAWFVVLPGTFRAARTLTLLAPDR
jgi:hypothetical protein